MKSLEEVYSFRSLLRDVRTFVRPHRGRFWLATGLRVLGDLANLYPAIAFAAVVTFVAKYEAGDSLDLVWILLGLTALATLVRYVSVYAAKRIMFAVSAQIAVDAQLTAIDHMFRLPALWHEKENTGNKLKRIDRGAYGFDKILRIWVVNIIEILINFFGIVIIIATIEPIISASLLIFLIVFFFLSRFFIVRGGKASEAVNKAEEEVSGLLFESLNNIRTVQVLDMPKALGAILSVEAKQLYQKIRTRVFWFQTGNAVRGISGNLFQIGMMAFIVWGISIGRYELGFLVLFNNYFNRIWGSVQEFSEVTQELVVARYSVGRLMRILNTPASAIDESHLAEMPHDWSMISLNNISFSYNDTSVLQDVSLTIRRGEKVGLVGLSGAGKSTLFKLLLREHEPERGTITIDSLPLADIRRHEYYSKVATVLQDTEVFNFSLRQNITLAQSEQSKNDALIERAMEVSHVKDFIRKLPEGADTKIGEKGVKLSGGERQRLGIARAVFKQPDLLLLDEATSHLDVESEEKIKDSLHEFFQSVTAVVIAHRLSTIQSMDRIIVLEHGRIVEEGGFDDLLGRRGRFFELWEKQRL